VEKLLLNNVNNMPMRTWNRLGVNGTKIEIPTDKIGAYSTDPVKSSGGSDVELTPVVSGNVALFDKDIATGMGDETRDFVKNNRNAGYLIEVAAGAKVKEPVLFDYFLNDENPALVDENIIIAGEGSEVTIVMKYTSQGGILHAGLTRVYAHKNAVVNLVQVQILDDGCLHFDDIGTAIFESGTLNLVQAELGGSQAYSGCKAQLALGAKFTANTIYLGDKQRKIDINYTAEQSGRDSQSDISVRGVLLDQSSKIFRGTIDFKRGAHGAKGREEEYNMLLSPNVRNRTVPVILCAEEDVDGQHAASIGRIDESKLFYMMSRGLSLNDAKKLLIKAAFEPVTAKIPIPEIREQISAYVEERINVVE
jgi:FeS assembly protein SufD